jgi:hypothetical protein
MSMSEAEEFLAELWYRLEEYGIRTPSIQLKTTSGGMVSLQLSLESSEAAQLALGRKEFSFDHNPVLVRTTATRQGGRRHTH